MDVPRKLTLVSYAVNGAGLGHVSRLVAINRWLRRYGAFAGVRTQHWFLTTSEADTLLFAEGFAAFKLPSKSIVEDAGIPKLEYLALAKQWIWSSLALLRPDLLIVDTFPNGSFDELAAALDLARKKALVLRSVRAQIAERASFQALVQLYDRVIVPEHAPDDVPARTDRVRFVGPIVTTERWEALPRDEARRRLGVPADAFCLLVSGGGGGDASVARVIDDVLAAAASQPDLHVVVAAGPLYRGEPRRGPGITFWTEPRLGECLGGVDGAISAGGFNSVHELLHLGVPSAFYAQPKIADDQEARVAALVDAGVALAVNPADRASVAAAIAAMRDNQRADALRTAGRAFLPRAHGREAAAELLTLLLPRALVRHAVEEVDEALLAELRTIGVALDDVVDAAIALAGGARAPDRTSIDLDGARALLRAARAVDMPARHAVRLAELLGRKLGGQQRADRADEIAEAAAQLIGHRAVRGQWTALLTVVERLALEREAAVRRSLADIEAVLEAADGSADLFHVATELGRMADAGEVSGRAVPASLRQRLAARPERQP